MDNLSIDNALLRPQLAEGWVVATAQKPACIKNTRAGQGFEINEITLMILNLCDGSQSVESIIESLGARFPEAGSEIADDVEGVLRNLNEAGALALVSALPLELFNIPEKTPKHRKRKLCIGMATYDDYDGVYFTLQAIRLYHPEVLDDLEFLVVDNHPDGPCAKSLKRLEGSVPAYRYIPFNMVRGTAVRDIIFREANAEYVMCIDSHVFIEAGVLKRLLDYFDAHPGTKDLLQGPLLNDDMRNIFTHFSPKWSVGMYGTWSRDSRADDIDHEAFDIPMQGLGLFACARRAWPGFNPRFSGFGGEEGYIHEKFRQAGGRTLCLPFLRWLHRFNRPMGVPYSVKWDDRVRNYLIGRDELGLGADDVIEHFAEHIGEKNTQRIVATVTAEIENPFYYFDAIYCLVASDDMQTLAEMQAVFVALEVSSRVIVIHLSDYSDEENVARILAYRELISLAKENASENLLIFDEVSAPDIIMGSAYKNAITELKQLEWSVFYLEAQRADAPAKHGEALLKLTETEAPDAHCFAMHSRILAQCLANLPVNEEDAGRWLEATDDFAAYISENVSGRFAPAYPLLK
jgi:hypothetical protein